MALSDWDRQWNTDNDFLDDSRAFEGSSSLRMQNLDNSKAYIWPASREPNDSPSEGRLETRTYMTGSQHTAVGFLFRADESYVTGNDASGHYFAWFGYDDSEGNFGFEVYSYFGNTGWANGNRRTLAADGAAFADQWTPYRVDFWVDENGDLRIQGFHDADLDGTWTLVNPNTDIVDTNPGNQGGGGMGFGSTTRVQINNDVNYEASKVYY